MTKRLIILSFISIFVALNAMTQTYSNLWKQVESAQSSDLPQEQLVALNQIIKKAKADKSYGHLLKAELQRIAVQTEVSPDSLAPMIKEYSQYATNTGSDTYKPFTTDESLRAVYNTTLGHIYKNYYHELRLREIEANKLSNEYYKQALASPATLAKARVKTFEPLTIHGANSSIFNNDLLHIIAFEAEDYTTMIDYYTLTGNRSAACMASLFKLRGERSFYEEQKKSKYLALVDSLIHEYHDLDVAGELAIEHFNVMDASPDVSAEEKITFIDDALFRWQEWPRMVVLKNARSRITLPSYNIDIPETLTIPNKEIPVYITSLKNIQSIFMNVYRVDITGEENYDPNNSDDYKTVISKRDDKPLVTDSRTYYGLPEYREIRDTLFIDPLPIGVYLVEFSTDNSSVPTERIMLNITNLRLINMNLPEDKMRLIVVDATTGKPIPNAHIRVKFREWRERKWEEDDATLTTESDGEVLYSSTLSPYKYRVTTTEDKAFPWQSISRRAWNGSNDNKKTTHVLKLYSDRAIYRPNQTVQASVLAYTTYSQEQWEVAVKKKIHLILRNSKNNIIDEKDVITDEWGVACTTFDLPTDATTGYYSLRATADDTSGTCSFHVEEYKRPTFNIEIDEYNKRYKADDTIIVRGWAKTFSGMPVSNAKVTYSVKTQLNHWWRTISNSNSEELTEEETQTESDGSFLMRVPMEFPSNTKKGNRFARITLSTQVTDLAGETHATINTYPLSDKETAFDLSGFEDKQCREEIKSFSFVYLNNLGNAIADSVTYTIDDANLSSAPTNTELQLPISRLTSGLHTLKAVCQNDTIEQPFVVFSLEDKVAPIETNAWYYSTSGQSRKYIMKEGQTEYIQLGTSRADQTIFYAITSDTTLLESGQLKLSNELVKWELLYKEDWGNGVAVRYSWVRDGKLYTFSESLSRPVKDCSLNVEFKSFRNKLVPGKQEEWTITVKNPDQSPAKAQVMAVLFDKSLDAIYQHDWTLTHTPYYASPTIYQTATYNNGEQFVYGEQSIRYLTEPTLQFYRFDFPYFYTRSQTFIGLPLANGVMKTRSALLSTAEPLSASISVTPEASEDLAASTLNTYTQTDTSTRENLDETAFFMPQLTTDKSGNVSIKFTLPESLTTWRFMSIAHDKTMNVGSLQAEAIAQKNLMVQPNMPRFIREGDKAQLSANISNVSDKTLSALATITIINPETENIVFKDTQPCTVASESTSVITFNLPTHLTENVYACDVTVETDNLTDGERHYLPVLSNNIEVVTTRAFTQNKAGEKVINITPLYGNNTAEETLQVEYTDNPAWLMLDALPVVETPESDNAISLSVALYANNITDAIKKQLPNDILTEKKVPTSVGELTDKLRQLQNSDGSFSWFKGMHPSVCVTQTVAKHLVRARHLGFTIDEDILSNSLAYLDKEISSYVEKLRKIEKESGKKPLPDDLAMDYLYLQAINGETLTALAKDNAEYLLPCMRGCSTELTIYGKANVAVIFACHPVEKDFAFASELLNSVLQYSVKSDEMGRYFDTPKAFYSWQDYKIPTQTATIEALQTIMPTDKATIADFQQWLLQEKRTQQWDTPLNSASAIYAFFNGWNDFEGSSLGAVSTPERIEQTLLYVDGKQISGDKKLSDRGFVSAKLEGRHNQFMAKKSSDNVSWGSISVTCTQPLEDVTTDGEYLSVKREVLDADGNELTTYPSVGQKLKIRITVQAKRDLDFVEITDNRAACLESVNQLSGYHDGYFVTPLDNKTVYYFDKFPKGIHVVESEYYVDRKGYYRTGLATVKCLYAPEYQAREESFEIEVK